jgi:phage protein D
MDTVTYSLTVGSVPMPESLLDAVQQIEVDSTVEEASVFRIRLGIAQTPAGDWGILDTDPFTPFVPVQIRVQRGAGPPLTLINGFVTNHQVSFSGSPGSRTLDITGMDKTILMNLDDQVQSWPNMSDSAIATQIFTQYSLVPMVDQTSPVLVAPQGTTIQRASDIRFVRGLARRNGFDCYVQPDPLSGTDLGLFRARRLAGPAQAVLSVGFGTETNTQDFTVRYELAAPTGAVAGNVDLATRTPQTTVVPTTAETLLGLQGTLARQTPAGVVRLSTSGLPGGADLQREAQSLVDSSSWSVVAEGTVGRDVPLLVPGGLVNVRGAGRLYNGSYLLTRVRHTIGEGRYTQRFEARRNAVTATGAENYAAVP